MVVGLLTFNFSCILKLCALLQRWRASQTREHRSRQQWAGGRRPRLVHIGLRTLCFSCILKLCALLHRWPARHASLMRGSKRAGSSSKWSSRWEHRGREEMTTRRARRPRLVPIGLFAVGFQLHIEVVCIGAYWFAYVWFQYHIEVVCIGAYKHIDSLTFGFGCFAHCCIGGEPGTQA